MGLASGKPHHLQAVGGTTIAPDSRGAAVVTASGHPLTYLPYTGLLDLALTTSTLTPQETSCLTTTVWSPVTMQRKASGRGTTRLRTVYQPMMSAPILDSSSVLPCL